MLFYSEFKRCLRLLSPEQKNIILRNVIAINLIFITVVCAFAFRIQRAKLVQDKFIQSQTVQQHIPITELAKIHNQAMVNAKVYMFYVKDINLKEVSIPVTFALSLAYKESDFPAHTPDIELNNGTVITQTPYFKHIESGEVSEVIVYKAEIIPTYQLQLYPLDKQLISLRASAKDWLEEPFYLKVTGMYIEPDALIQTGDYTLTQAGYINPIESYSMLIGHNNMQVSSVISNAYMVFNHKNIYTYIKNIQYIILSLLIALFSLLINSKTASPKNGRVAVIGSSVFSLAANAFQINSTIKSSNVFTLIDFITIFAGLIILTCYITTVKTLKLIDTENYETSKAFDFSVFYSLLAYTIIFFVSIYIYA